MTVVKPRTTGDVHTPLPMSMMLTKSIEQRQLEALENIVRQLDEIITAGGKLWPDLFDTGPVLGDDGKPLDVSDVVQNVEPTETPFMKEHSKHKRKRK